MKYFSKSQIIESLKRLEGLNQFFGFTYLAAKMERLPVGETKHVSLDTVNNKFLNEYYRPDPRSKYFFRVFRFNNKHHYWLKPGYSGKGLQKLNTTSFKDAFIHTDKSKYWGWSENYLDILSSKIGTGSPVPAFHLAVWLFRNEPWHAKTSINDVIQKFYSTFHISEEEIQALFAKSIDNAISDKDIFSSTPVNWKEIGSAFDSPPDIGPELSGILTYLEIIGVGPVSPLCFEPGSRLNIVTGDNGLGKTFLLEIAWWALTGRWSDRPIYPNLIPNSPPKGQIKFQISGVSIGKPQTIHYSPQENIWPEPKNRATIPGLIVYARVDGSFAVWDPAGSSATLGGKNILVFNREEVWDGKPGRMEGLIRDWTKWQDKPNKYPFEIFKKVLARLSPPEMAPLTPGEPVRLFLDAREIPTIKHNYGEVPILFESAGIRRIIMLAYLIVWTWNEHRIISEQTSRKLESKMVVMMDEIEAHLHPRWQRSILPALLGVSGDLSSSLEIQLMVATHSPLVLASAESAFDFSTDKLFHLECAKSGKVDFREIPYLKYGPVDSWLTSNVFELRQARSQEAEDAISRAIELQKTERPAFREIEKVSELLADTLSPEDRFWPRWVFFAQRHGVAL